MTTTLEPIAIVGAGLCGAAAARVLLDAGTSVAVFDKSRGTGGRLATRRTEAGAFDHGAPWAHGDGAFGAAMAALPASAAERDGAGWRGRPGMSGLVKPLLDGARLHLGSPVTHLRHDAGWRVETEAGATHGPFAGLIVAIPAPQLAALWPAAAPDLAAIRMAPCWSLITSASAMRRDPIDVAVQQRGGPGAVLHADADWSRANLELDKGDAADRLIAALGIARPDYAVAHRWRFARTNVPFGRPYLALGPAAFGGGDWALGPDAGDAFTSGRAMARALLTA